MLDIYRLKNVSIKLYQRICHDVRDMSNKPIS